MGFPRSIKSTQRQVVMLSAKVDGTGTASIAGTCSRDMSLTDSGTGDYLVGFPGFEQLPEILITPVTTGVIARLGTVAKNSVQVLLEDAAGDPIDGDFHILVIGCNALDLI